MFLGSRPACCSLHLHVTTWCLAQMFRSLLAWLKGKIGGSQVLSRVLFQRCEEFDRRLMLVVIRICTLLCNFWHLQDLVMLGAQGHNLGCGWMSRCS